MYYFLVYLQDFQNIFIYTIVLKQIKIENGLTNISGHLYICDKCKSSFITDDLITECQNCKAPAASGIINSFDMCTPLGYMTRGVEDERKRKRPRRDDEYIKTSCDIYSEYAEIANNYAVLCANGGLYD